MTTQQKSDTKGPTTMSRSTLLLAAIATAALATTLAACSSSGDGSGSSGTAAAPASSAGVTKTATSTATATATKTVGTIASGEPNPASNGSSRCAESQLRASIDTRRIPGNGTAGSDGHHLHGVLVDFENKSGSTCTIYGYPGAAIVGSDGKQVQQATRVRSGALGGSTPLKTVTLKPGAYAAAMLEGIGTQDPGTAQAGCDGPKFPKILVTPPNTETPVPFTVGWPQCTTFTVHPVQALASKP